MKKLLSVLLAATTALSVCGGLAACGGSGEGTAVDPDPNKIVVWAPEKSIGSKSENTGYWGLVNKFVEENSELCAGFTFDIVNHSEGDVQGLMGTNPVAGAEVFFFASDHYGNMMKNKYLTPLGEANGVDYGAEVRNRDNKGTYDFVTEDGKIYAFPATNDNGYFLYYNDQYLTEEQAKSFDTIMSVAKNGKKHVNTWYDNSWYSGTFLMGLGCKFNYTDTTMAHYHGDFNTPAGYAAGDAMIHYASADVNEFKTTKDGKTVTDKVIYVAASEEAMGSSLLKGETIANIGNNTQLASIRSACVKDNTDKATNEVDEDAVEAAMSHIKMTVLPTFKATLNGVQGEYHMGTFYGGKYCGVNRSKSEEKIKVSLALADYLTTKEAQLVRFGMDGAGPSNNEAAAKVVEDADENDQESYMKVQALNAYNAQVALSTSEVAKGKPDPNCVQGAQSDPFWGDSGIKSLTKAIFGTPATVTTHDQVVSKLNDLQKGLNT